MSRSQLLLYKKMDPMNGFAVGDPINVTLSVFNKGAHRHRSKQSRRSRRLSRALHAATRPQAWATRTASW